jgi:hypothetical protein
MARAMSSKQETRESCPRFDYFLLCLTRFSLGELVLARQLALKGYGLDENQGKSSR